MYDVIVIGAGPAGSEAAFRIAKLGYDVLMLEKEVGTREKACGGGVGKIALDEFDRPPDDIIEREVTNFLLVSRSLYSVNFSLDRFSVDSSLITVMRSKYDSWLQRRAVEQGAKFIEKAKVTKILLKDYPEITVNSGTLFKTRLLIDASGAQSIVRRNLGLVWSRKDIAIGMQYHVELSSQDIDKRFENCCEFYFDSTTAPEGYYWIFPKRESVAVGICGSASIILNRRIDLKDKLDHFIERHPLVSHKLYDGHIKLRKSGILPLRICDELVFKNAMIVGDAGGFVNSLSKGGIYSARKSSEIASQYAVTFLETGQQEELLGYEAEVKNRFRDQSESNKLIIRVLNDDEFLDKLIQGAGQTKMNSYRTFINTLKFFAVMYAVRSDSEKTSLKDTTNR